MADTSRKKYRVTTTRLPQVTCPDCPEDNNKLFIPRGSTAKLTLANHWAAEHMPKRK